MKRGKLCESGRHCLTCRKPVEGSGIRGLIARQLGIEPGDFECPFGVPRPDQVVELGIKSVIRGAVGLAKAKFNLEPVEAPTLEQRLAICESCPEHLSEFDKCRICGCNIPAKCRVASEKCPLGKWGPV